MYAVITGASSGIGEQFAKRLAKEGYDLILVARRRERLTALSDKLKATHKELKCDIFTADLMQLDECQRLSDYLEEKDIEIFINNAGYGDCGLFEETDIAKEMGMIDVNVRAVHFLTKKLLRQMRVKDRGFILNVASSAGLIPAGPYKHYGRPIFHRQPGHRQSRNALPGGSAVHDSARHPVRPGHCCGDGCLRGVDAAIRKKRRKHRHRQRNWLNQP